MSFVVPLVQAKRSRLPSPGERETGIRTSLCLGTMKMVFQRKMLIERVSHRARRWVRHSIWIGSCGEFPSSFRCYLRDCEIRQGARFYSIHLPGFGLKSISILL